jgi:thymidylate kinase
MARAAIVHGCGRLVQAVAPRFDIAGESMSPVSMGNTGRRRRARLYVFEGVDQSLRAALAEAFARLLEQKGISCLYLPCQKREAMSEGEFMGAERTRSARNPAAGSGPVSEQLLDTALRIRRIETEMRSALASGKAVVTDSFWWSISVDGRARGVPKASLRRMVEIERQEWDSSGAPDAIFLVRKPVRGASRSGQGGAERSYDELSRGAGLLYTVRDIDDEGTVDELATIALARSPEALLRVVSPSFTFDKQPSTVGGQEGRELDQLGFGFVPKSQPTSVSRDLSRHLPQSLRPTKVFETYWRFAAERQEVFFKRLEGTSPPWTVDPIISEYRFTNAYRAADRVSQYLIRNVTYRGAQTVEEVFFRTLLYKFFNKIETWNLLESALGEISFASYDFQRYDQVLTQAMARGEKIYSAAYVMPTARGFDSPRKHGTHLRLLEHLMKEQVPQRMADAKDLRAAFEVLRSYPMMGDFLAYQYVNDLNYSAVYNFKEDFVVPGPGARDGIRKCFEDLGGLTESQIIEQVANMQEAAFEDLGIRFRSLWSHRLQLIDCQNLFCEVDKYSRVAHPDVQGISGRTRIKQHYRYDSNRMEYWFPPKWGLNERVAAYMASLRQQGESQRIELMPSTRGG